MFLPYEEEESYFLLEINFVDLSHEPSIDMFDSREMIQKHPSIARTTLFLDNQKEN